MESISNNMTKKIRVYTDGGARGNPGPAAIGVVVCDENDRIIFQFKRRIGRATNNEAEYNALIKGLELARDYTHGEIECIADSLLIVSQMRGEYKVKKKELKELFEKAKKLESKFRKVSYSHMERENKMIAEADRLVNEALDGISGKLPIGY